MRLGGRARNARAHVQTGVAALSIPVYMVMLLSAAFAAEPTTSYSLSVREISEAVDNWLVPIGEASTVFDKATLTTCAQRLWRDGDDLMALSAYRSGVCPGYTFVRFTWHPLILPTGYLPFLAGIQGGKGDCFDVEKELFSRVRVKMGPQFPSQLLQLAFLSIASDQDEPVMSAALTTELPDLVREIKLIRDDRRELNLGVFENTFWFPRERAGKGHDSDSVRTDSLQPRLEILDDSTILRFVAHVSLSVRPPREKLIRFEITWVSGRIQSLRQTELRAWYDWDAFADWAEANVRGE